MAPRSRRSDASTTTCGSWTPTHGVRTQPLYRHEHAGAFMMPASQLPAQRQSGTAERGRSDAESDTPLLLMLSRSPSRQCRSHGRAMCLAGLLHGLRF